MMTKFWDKLAEGLGQTWNARLLLPGAAWLGAGILAFCAHYGFRTLQALLAGLDTTAGLALAVAGLFLMAVLSWLVQELTLPVIRLFEGYWPRFLAGLAEKIAGQEAARLDQKRKRRSQLYRIYREALEAGPDLPIEEVLSAQELAEFIRLDGESGDYPLIFAHFLPTQLGNRLRAAEEYPLVRYGLEMKTVWPRLWLVLPEDARKELSEARQALDQRAQLMLWAILLATWVLWSWWAVAAAILAAFGLYFSLMGAAGVYGELLRAAFDLHRFKLYEALCWKLPLRPAGEEACGRALTLFLHYGEAPALTKFEAKSTPK